MIKNIEIEILEEADSIIVPFDENSSGKYSVEINKDEIENGDVIVLKLDKKACYSFSKIFGQLALGNYQEGFHLHLGLDNEDPGGQGIRVVLHE